MKLVIQIPCYNEANTIASVLNDLPIQIEGINEIDILIIDDGSTDNTVEIAQRWGKIHFVRHPKNLGLAKGFEHGLEASLKLGADIIVNTDGDNQYPGQYIPDLIRPILLNQADIVVGDRRTDTIPHFSPLKKILQRWGSWVVRQAAGINKIDATSGFRAFSREAALRLIILTNYTYTLETLIQAGKKGLIISTVPITANPPLRESRLIKSTWSYVKRSAATILKLYVLYEPFKTFMLVSSPFLIVGATLVMRFGILYLLGESGIGRHLQSIIVGTASLIIGFVLVVLGVLGDLISVNRVLIEETLYHQKKEAFKQNDDKFIGEGNKLIALNRSVSHSSESN